MSFLHPASHFAVFLRIRGPLGHAGQVYSVLRLLQFTDGKANWEINHSGTAPSEVKFISFQPNVVV